jgi:thiol-disulfide isomerase/thioredoxin
MEAPSLHSSDSHSISVHWIPVPHANSYTLQYRNSLSPHGHPSDWVPLPAITGNIIRKKNLNSDGVYCFRVIPNFNEVSDRWVFSPPSGGFTVCRFPLYTKNLLGMKLIDAAGNEVSVESLAEHTLGIYASASWCGPCRQFTPSLISFYNEARASGRKFQIIFVSCDRDKQSFDSYFSKMPWLAIPYESEARKTALEEMQVVVFDDHCTWIIPGSCP